MRVSIVARLESHPLPRPRVIHSAYGVRFDVDTGDDVERRFFFDAYETEELALLPSLVRPGDTCLDVGANVGLYTVVLARLVGPSGRVHAFEADPRNVAKLERNVALNGFDDRVTIHPVVVAAETGTADFNMRAVGHSGHGSVHRYEGHDSSTVLPAVSLGDVLEREGIDRVALLKVDVEGSDMDVYEGARAALDRGAFRSILAEWNGYWFPRWGWTVQKFLNYFEELGYQPRGDAFRPWSRLMEDPVERESWVANVLLVSSRATASS